MAGRCSVGKEPESGVMVVAHGEWKLFVRNGNGRWVNMKVLSSKPALKANYRLSIDVVTGKLVRSRDLRLLQDHEPGVYRWLIAVSNDPQAVAAIMCAAFPGGNT